MPPEPAFSGVCVEGPSADISQVVGGRHTSSIGTDTPFPFRIESSVRIDDVSVASGYAVQWSLRNWRKALTFRDAPRRDEYKLRIWSVRVAAEDGGGSWGNP